MTSIDVQMDLGAQRYTRFPNNTQVPAGKRQAVRRAEALEAERVREHLTQLREDFYRRQAERGAA